MDDVFNAAYQKAWGYFSGDQELTPDEKVRGPEILRRLTAPTTVLGLAAAARSVRGARSRR